MNFELREMDFFTIIDRGLKLFKSNFVPLVILMAIFFGPFLFAMNYNQYKIQDTTGFPENLASIIEKITSQEEPEGFDSIIDQLFEDPAAQLSFGLMYAFALLMFILTPLAYISAYKTLLGYIKGEKIEFRDAVKHGASRYWTLMGAFVLFGFLISVLACVIPLSAFFLGPIGFALMGILIVFIFPIIAFQVMLPCVVSVEKTDIVGSLRRNFNLLKGFYWRTFGIYLVIAIIVGLISGIFASVGEMIGGQIPGTLGLSFKAAVSTMFSVIFQPIVLCVMFLTYLDIRIRKEGFDMDILADRALGEVPAEQTSGPQFTGEEPRSDDLWK